MAETPTHAEVRRAARDRRRDAAALAVECADLHRRLLWAEAVAEHYSRLYARERGLRIQAGRLAAAALSRRLSVRDPALTPTAQPE